MAPQQGAPASSKYSRSEPPSGTRTCAVIIDADAIAGEIAKAVATASKAKGNFFIFRPPGLAFWAIRSLQVQNWATPPAERL